MLDYKGDVAEATGANIFFNMGGELHTPTPVCFLDGITRRTVMASPATTRSRWSSAPIRESEMKDASEVFLAGTAAEVTPVREIAGLRFTPGDLTKTLMTDYEKLVRLSPAEVAKNGA